MAGSAAVAEAVIISGPRRGEIVELRREEDSWHPDDLALLNQALDDVIAAIDRLSAQVRAATEALVPKEDC